MGSNQDQTRKRFEQSSSETHSVNPEMSVQLTQSDHNQSTKLFTDRTSVGHAVRCFLSPFDAMLDGLGLISQELSVHFEIRPVRNVAPEAFLSCRGFQRPLSFHLAWLAHDYRLVVRENGCLTRLTLTQGRRPRGDSDQQSLQIDSDVWTIIDALHQQAGLFAWRETQKAVRQWLDAPASARDALERAFCLRDDPPLIQFAPNEAKQLALYDPEAARWHFVQRQVFG
ncbi:hypothetical protein [Paraburkholderia bryophila]|uniref:Uncharacterized protein n=1 Tax=Paraburkholderia bryophila TaxID=420952 RepID=A0A7Y9W8R3_9BURK|nr:hypothetical protein [Paraburkholderia bryophila]NYH16285.1 hypothetical protein [Paraburkholderia bryophila]